MTLFGKEPVGFIQPFLKGSMTITFNYDIGKWDLANIVGLDNKKQELFTANQVLKIIKELNNDNT